MFTIWCCAMRPLPSVNGMVKTSGSVPAASAAVNVGAVQLYSSGWTVIHGYFVSNSEVCRFSAATASWVAPGRRTPTLMVTGAWATADGPDDGAPVFAGPVGADDAAGVQGATRAIKPTIVPMRFNLLVAPPNIPLAPLDALQWLT